MFFIEKFQEFNEKVLNFVNSFSFQTKEN